MDPYLYISPTLMHMNGLLEKWIDFYDEICILKKHDEKWHFLIEKWYSYYPVKTTISRSLKSTTAGIFPRVAVKRQNHSTVFGGCVHTQNIHKPD